MKGVQSDHAHTRKALLGLIDVLQATLDSDLFSDDLLDAARSALKEVKRHAKMVDSPRRPTKEDD